jgi:DNA-binding NtrC family response regulator
VADDDKAVAWLWARLLQWGFGAEVLVVFNGNNAIARIAAERFDLVITDLQMPGASGLDVLRHVKARHPDVPVVIATGYAPDHVLAEATRLGARGIIRKPFDLDAAVALARTVLGPTRTHRTVPGDETRAAASESRWH